VHVNSDGTVETAKLPSTPSSFAAGVIDVVSAASGGQTMLAEAGYFYHGTTVATNAMITMITGVILAESKQVSNKTARGREGSAAADGA
jgi:N-methylhydantoinase A/oxoprolinase/acetone carboxylase beta subunit